MVPRWGARGLWGYLGMGPGWYESAVQKRKRQPQMIAQREVPGGGIEPPTRGFSVPTRESGDFPPFSSPYRSRLSWDNVGICWVLLGYFRL